MVVRHVLVQSASQRALAKQDQLGKTLLLDRAHPALGKSVEVRTADRQPHGAHAAGAQDRAKPCAELGVAVMNQKPEAPKKAPILLVTLRAIWLIHSWWGCGVMPATCTLRLAMSMKNRT